MLLFRRVLCPGGRQSSGVMVLGPLTLGTTAAQEQPRAGDEQQQQQAAPYVGPATTASGESASPGNPIDISLPSGEGDLIDTGGPGVLFIPEPED